METPGAQLQNPYNKIQETQNIWAAFVQMILARTLRANSRFYSLTMPYIILRTWLNQMETLPHLQTSSISVAPDRPVGQGPDITT